MEKVFVPYSGDVPAVVDVNGHKVLIVSSDFESILDELELIGGDEIREFDLPDSAEDQTEALAALAADFEGGIVVAPPGVSASMMIETLADQLPWIH